MLTRLRVIVLPPIGASFRCDWLLSAAATAASVDPEANADELEAGRVVVLVVLPEAIQNVDCEAC